MSGRFHRFIVTCGVLGALLAGGGPAARADDDDEFDFLEDEDLPENTDVEEADAPDLPPADAEAAPLDEDPDFDAPLEPADPDDLDADPDEPGVGPSDLDEDPEEPGLGLPDEDDPLEDFEKPAAAPKGGGGAAPEAAAKPAAVGGIGLEADGHQPLAGGFPLRVVARDMDAVVVELPVLVSRNRGDFKAGSFWLVAEILADGRKVGESRQLVAAEGVADLTPTFVFVKSFVPVARPQGTIVVKVARQPLDGGPAEPLFEATGSYRL